MSEVVRALSAKDAVDVVGAHIAEYGLRGGPDREAEDIELGQQHGLKLEKIKSLWSEARTERARAAKLAEPPPVTRVERRDLRKPATQPALKSPAIQPPA